MNKRISISVGLLLAFSSCGAADLFFAGDSTLHSRHYLKTREYPEEERCLGSWCDELEHYLKPGVRIVNPAYSGCSTKSFRDSGRWDRLIAQVKPGDFVYIQFGHNDQKKNRPEVYAAADGAFKENMRRFAEEVRAKGGKPVFGTPLVRRFYRGANDDRIADGLGEYPDAVRSLGKEIGVPVVDFNAFSRRLVESAGREESLKWYRAVLNKTDFTHLTRYGAKVMARGFYDEVKKGGYEIANLLRDGSLPEVKEADVCSAAADRTVVELKGGWTADGAPVTVPHTWNTIDATDGEGRAENWAQVGYSSGALSYARKTVVYRRALPDAKPGRRYFVRCGGASIRAEVKVNGVKIGRHVGAFTAFCYEATAAMKPSGNTLEIAVDNKFDPDVQPIHADFSVYGGLYRVPELIETGAVCIDPVTDGARGVRIETDVATGSVTAHVSVLGGTNEIQRFRFPNPRLWSPESPNLYTVKVTVRQKGCEDSLDVRFGFRTIEFRKDGFYLNGVKRRIRGVCRHQDRAGLGWGRSREDEAEDIRWIKLMGADGVRTSHYPQSEAFYDLCDEHGLLVWTEVPNVNGLTFTETARENEIREAREMVQQNRNHPCIFAWGIFNELYNKKMEQAPEPRMAALRDYVKSLDPTRPVTAASNKVRKSEINAVPDILGFNLYPGWYGRSADKMGEVIDEAFKLNPTRTTAAVSEYGGGGSFGQHADAKERPPRSTAPFHPEEYHAYLHWGNYGGISRDPRIWGSFVWVMFDLASDARREGSVFGMNDKGMVTWDRMNAKDAFYFYKANWNPAPELHLVGSRMTETTAAKGTVMAFSNVGKVSLYIDGKLYGEKEPDDLKTVLWEDVPFRRGLNEIEVRAGNFRKTARWTRRAPDFPKLGKPRRLTNGPKEHFLASYTGINSWSADNRYLLVLETDVNGRLSAAGEPCTIGVVDTKDSNRFIPFAETRAWNFQEAAMGHWLKCGKDVVLFNDFRDGKFVTVIMNWRTKKTIRVIPYPVSAVSEDGRKAISLNYARIRLTRPDYGYAGPGQDPGTDDAWPKDDGLWLVDLMTGDAKLIVSIASVRDRMPKVGPKGLAYFCHTVFSKDGSRVFWLARGIDWYDPVKEKAAPWSTTAFTCRTDGTDVRRCFPDNWGGSHFNWLDDKTMVVTVYPKAHARGAWHVTFTVGEEEKVHRLAPGILDWDGHCVWSPNGKWISTEGYPDKTSHRNWALMRTDDEAVIPVGSFFVPKQYGSFWRCDLHGRWRPDGKQLGFNSVHEGSRQVYVIDVEE